MSITIGSKWNEVDFSTRLHRCTNKINKNKISLFIHHIDSIILYYLCTEIHAEIRMLIFLYHLYLIAFGLVLSSLPTRLHTVCRPIWISWCIHNWLDILPVWMNWMTERYEMILIWSIRLNYHVVCRHIHGMDLCSSLNWIVADSGCNVVKIGFSYWILPFTSYTLSVYMKHMKVISMKARILLQELVYNC